MPYRAASRGDTFIVVGPAGSGYGDPMMREPERVLSDVLDGFMTREQARIDYDVVIRDDLAIDHEGTAGLRREDRDADRPQAGRETEANRTLAMPMPSA
jgi:N-methylhydantoinase B/oxoprolinase/acetone carboxylase alpha subunit